MMASKLPMPSSISRLPTISTRENVHKRRNSDTEEFPCSPEKKIKMRELDKDGRKPIARPRGKLRRSVSMASFPVPGKNLTKMGSANIKSVPSNLNTRASSVTFSAIKKYNSKPVNTGIGRQPGANITNRVINTKPPSRPKANADTTTKNLDSANRGKNKRQPWDLKGKLMDMEQILKETCSKNSDYDSRLAALEKEKKMVTQNLEQAKTHSVEAEEEIALLKAELREGNEKIRHLEQNLTEKEDKLFENERQIKRLQDELASKIDENTGLKSSVSTLISSTSGMEAELKGTKILLETSTNKCLELEKLTKNQADSITELKMKLVEREDDRRKIHNMVQELKGNIRVFCRVRPIIGDESVKNGGDVINHINFLNEKSLELFKPGNMDGSSMTGLKNRSNKYEFAFDHVFVPGDSQDEIFKEVSQLVQSALDGYNVCIFAYGQTGSGKTFTMEGSYTDDFSKGVIPRSVAHIFSSMESLEDVGWRYNLEVSFLEIYNETIRDLLANPKDATSHQYEIRMSDGKKPGIYVTNLKVVPVENIEKIYHLLNIAQQHRAVAATNMNEHSSRSHSVFQLKICGNNLKTGNSCDGTLNLVDLAGSERLKESGSEGARLTETRSINSSLANLGNVIMAKAQKQSHIPYRNSKLTHLLQNSLGGNSKTLMFVNVSPDLSSFNETINSLRFATKVNECHIGTAARVKK